MMNRNFHPKWVKWVVNTVKGGKVCINVNGERSNYFSTYRGMRQGIPFLLSFLTFVADVLGVLLDKAVSKGHIKGVLGYLIPGGISHIQDVDDTIIMVDCSVQSIRNLKLILYCFE
jgi:hypothetical protein